MAEKINGAQAIISPIFAPKDNKKQAWELLASHTCWKTDL